MAEEYSRTLEFFVNGKKTVLRDVDPTLLLVDFLRFGDPAQTGTKLSCGEGGCGACTVVVAHQDPISGEVIERPVNACLRPLCSMDGTFITTTEGLGNHADYNPIQKRIACFNGSQCGFCTPGFVMSMYGLLRNNRRPTVQQVEDHFDGNLCRCTGYRPILNAMQSFVGDFEAADEAAGEPLPKSLFPKLRPLYFEGSGYRYYRPTALESVLALMKEHNAKQDNVQLLNGNTSTGIYKKNAYDPKILIDISRVAELLTLECNDDEGILIGGGVNFSSLLRFLEGVIDSRNNALTTGLVAMHATIKRIANENVRSVATVGGNLMLAKNHEKSGIPFPSDFFTVACVLDATVVLKTPDEPNKEKIQKLLSLPAPDSFPTGFVITKLIIPFTRKSQYVQTYKVARRIQNSHALVNAGFFLDLEDGKQVKGSLLIFGGIASLAFAAKKTSEFLKGRDWSQQTMTDVIPILRKEIEEHITPMPEDGVSTAYRAAIAEALLYKFFVRVCNSASPGSISVEDRSAGEIYVRPISTGSHDFVIAPYYDGSLVNTRVSTVSGRPGTPYFIANVIKKTPSTRVEAVTKQLAASLPNETPEKGPDAPSVKDSALIQATGEAKYTLDEAGPLHTLQAVYVYSENANATFDYGEPDGLKTLIAELKTSFPGFRGYITDKNIKSKSTKDTYNAADPGLYDPIFASGRVTSWGQPIGLVVAVTVGEAQRIAVLIRQRIRYSPIKPVFSIEEALNEPKADGILWQPGHYGTITRSGSDSSWLTAPTAETGKVFVSGVQRTGAQAHFYLETQVTLAMPIDDGCLLLFSSAQNIAACQKVAATALGMSLNKVQVKVNRLGGGFGAKEVRPPFIAAAAAVAASVLDAPVRLALDRNTDMAMIGKRHPYKGNYTLLADFDGRIQKAKYEFFSNAGYSYDCSLPVMDLVLLSADSCYNIDTFQAVGTACRTNYETRTAFRSFGVIQCSLIVEEGIEKLAHTLNRSPEDIRELNFYRDATIQSFDSTPYGQQLKYCRIRQVWSDLKTKSDFVARKAMVDEFNAKNRWRKRGISMIPIKYGVSYTFLPMNQGSAYIVAFVDGSVVVHHGGVEMGQGIDTKIRRLAADYLGIDIKFIQVGHSDTATIPNASSTGASTGTDLNGGAVRLAATHLRERMVQFCQDNDGAKDFPDWQGDWSKAWPTIVGLANSARLDLSAQATYASPRLADLDPKTNQLPPGRQIFYYFTYSAAVSEVEIDVLTGESTVLRSDIIYDAGQSLNSTLDFGQVEGGFVQGIGNVTVEEVYYSSEGRLIPNGTWNYKIPCSKTIPVQFNASLLEYVRTDLSTNAPMEHYGIQSSKSTGEPPLVLSISVFFAIKHAILAARRDQGNNDWFELDSPATVERIKNACVV